MTDARVVLEKAGDVEPDRRVLATEVEVADSLRSQALGLMFRASIPEEYALVMEVGDGGFLSSGPARQFVHMLFVRFPIDVVWLVDGEVRRTARMHPWRSFAVARADRILELPAGAAADVDPGDTVVLEGTERS